MIIVGIDPGVRKLGYSVIEIQGLDKCALKDMGVIRADKISDSLGLRLEFIHEEISKIIKTWNPRWVGLEKAVNFKNVDSAFKLTEARGVIRLACYQNLDQMDSRMVELSPTAIKKESTGRGQSTKEEIERAMYLRFANLQQWVDMRMEEGKEVQAEKLTHDSFDALAIAWTTWVKVRQKQRVGARLKYTEGAT